MAYLARSTDKTVYARLVLMMLTRGMWNKIRPISVKSHLFTLSHDRGGNDTRPETLQKTGIQEGYQIPNMYTSELGYDGLNGTRKIGPSYAKSVIYIWHILDMRWTGSCDIVRHSQNPVVQCSIISKFTCIVRVCQIVRFAVLIGIQYI